MSLLLGIDTGGTFTDAVLVDNSIDGHYDVIAKAKAPTTHGALERGVGEAVLSTLRAGGLASGADIALVSVSTTLATNALVEGHREPSGLIAIGLRTDDLHRGGISAVVESDFIAAIDGGHDAHGNERCPLPLDQVRVAAEQMSENVCAFAVASQFSVRNPHHELAAAELIRECTNRPVTMSHTLSARLDGPRRAVTAALNAQLLGTIERLNAAVRLVLADHGITAPLMVVRGDGSLVSAAFAARRPIETILSGPAASVVGALHLASVERGQIADVGGTTTDIATIRSGRPVIAQDGAVVGGHRTMVEAVDMATVGLGGDSEVRIDTRDDNGPILIGPERAVPLGRLAIGHPGVAAELERQLSAPVGLTSHGRFLVLEVSCDEALGRCSDEREGALVERLRDGPMPEIEAAPSGLDASAARRLRARGLVRVATMTPTDAAAALHVVAGRAVETIAGVDGAASLLGASVLARQTSSTGGSIASSGAGLAQLVGDLFVRRSAFFALTTALQADGVGADTHAGDLLEAALDHHRDVVEVSIRLTDPLVAIGAPAQAWYPHVGDMLATTAIVPDDADVANAIGAVVGEVRIRRSCVVTQPTRGQFRVHLDDQPTFGSVERAQNGALELLETQALAEAQLAGVANATVDHQWHPKVAVIDGREVFVEGTMSVQASGRPKI